jgi:hypothetical protein
MLIQLTFGLQIRKSWGLFKIIHMNIYNIVFVSSYRFRSSFKKDYNEIASIALVSVLQAMQIFCLIIMLILLGLPINLLKIFPFIFWGFIILSLLNQFYFYAPEKARALIEKDNLLNERDKGRNSHYALIVIILTIIAFFIICEIGHLYQVK